MIKDSKRVFVMCFSLLFAISLLFISFSEPAWAKDSEGDLTPKVKAFSASPSWDDDANGYGVHEDPATFQKNWTLTVDQKEQTITEIKKVVSAMETVKPEMSDLEKYFTLAVWANQCVEYDWKFWKNKYHFEYYSHQWDAYGAMNEKSVCVGIAIFYSNLCHAADLPSWFTRLDPGYLDHTIGYIPDINGNAYFVDITENDFLMSEATFPLAEYVDTEYAHIPEDRHCTDTTFDYIDEEGNPDRANIKEFYDKNRTYEEWFGENADPPTYEEWFRAFADHQTYEKWFNEYALHQVTDKTFETDYVEKGSGLPSTDPEYRHVSYHDYRSNFVDNTGIWFLDDFYANPAEIATKIQSQELDEQLLSVHELKKNYDTVDELEAAIANLSVKYFPTYENGNVVAKTADLEKGTDYEVNYTIDPETKTAVVTLNGKGDYTGTYQVRIKMNTAVVTKDPVCNNDLVYNKEPQELVKPGEAEGGELQYALGTKKEPTGEFSTNIPTATNAGNYFVWYRVEGDDDHASIEPQYIGNPVSIDPIKVKMILEDFKLKVGETGVISPDFDIENIRAKMPMTFTYKNWTDDIVSVSEDGVVKGLKEGRAVIFVDVHPKYSSSNYDIVKNDVVFVHVVAPDPVDIGETKVALSKTTFTYNGKVQKPSIKTIKGLKLKAGTDYTATWSNISSKNAGKYTVTIKGIGNYTGTTSATYTIAKAKNPITLKAKTVKVKYKNLAKKSQSMKRAKAFAVSKAQGKLSYKLVSAKKGKKNFKKKFSVNAKTGKVTVKKGLKEGTYKVKVKVKAKGNVNYKASVWKPVTFTVQVK